MAKSSKAKKNKAISYVAVVVVIVVALAAIVYVYKAQQLSSLSDLESQNAKQQKPTADATPTPLPKAIPHGKYEFTVTTSWPGPKFTHLVVDPYDPPKGGRMTISINANDTKPVQKIWATVQTDTKTSPVITFQRTQGDDMAGIWQGTWNVDDTYNNRYMITIEADSANGHTKDEVALR